MSAARDSWVRATLVAVTALAFGLRLWLADQVVAPFLFHDEGGYVAVGRALLGDAPELFGPRYAPGYGVLLTPAMVFLEPGGVHLTAKVLNAAALALLVPVTYLLARRVGRLDPWLALGTAVAGSAVAGLTVQATMLLPEAVLVLATTATVLLLHRWSTSPSSASALACGASAGAAYALHTRGAATVGAALVAVAVAVLARRVRPGSAALLAGTALVVAGAGHLLASWAADRLYPLASTGTEAGDLLAVFEDPLGVARTGMGHAWYLVLSTAGLAALGLVTASRLAWRQRGTPGGVVGVHVVAGVLAALVLSALVHRGVAAGVVDRPDKVVYGRYLQQWAPVLVTLAPALVRCWSRRAAAVAVLATAAASAGVAAALHVLYEPEVWSGPIAWHNIATLWLVQDWFGQLWVVRTALALAVIVVVVLAPGVRFDNRWAWSLPLGVVLVAGVLAAHGTVTGWASPASQAWAGSRQLGPVIEELDRPVAVDASVASALFHALNLQLWHPEIDVDLSFGDPGPAPELQIARLAAGPPAPGATLLATEPRLELGLWAHRDLEAVAP